MHIVDKIKQLDRSSTYDIYVDMDGVIADYDIGKSLNFLAKRPIKTNINTLREVALIPNVDLHILSICKTDNQIEEKNIWLDENAPFFRKENRIIISKQSHPKMDSKELKTRALQEQQHIKSERKIIVIDDDNEMLRYMQIHLENAILFQDSSIVD